MTGTSQQLSSQSDPRDNLRSSFDVGYSHRSGRRQVNVCCIRFCKVSVACNDPSPLFLFFLMFRVLLSAGEHLNKNS